MLSELKLSCFLVPCHVTIALVLKLVTWILRHRGLAITACKAGLRILSDDNLQQQDENASQAGEEMSTADAVSLFTTSALAQQKQEMYITKTKRAHPIKIIQLCYLT
jgi:hypothetical protein